MQGNEILVLKAQLDLCEIWRNKDPASIPEEVRPYFEIFRSINMSLEHLVLTAIEMINLREALTFNDRTQDSGYYRSTILRHICVPIHEFHECLFDSITGKELMDNTDRIPEVFEDKTSLEVPKKLRKILKDYNNFMKPKHDYFENIRNIACHRELKIIELISVLQTIDEDKIRKAFHRTLEFISEFNKVFGPLSKEFLERYNLQDSISS